MHLINAFLNFTSLSIRRVKHTLLGSKPGEEEALLDQDQQQHQATGATTNEQQQQQQQQNGSNSSGRVGASLTGEYEDFAHSSGAVKLFLCHCVLYYAVGLIGMCSLYDDFTWIDALYFLTTVFTTIGYGDTKPDTEAGRVFVIFIAVYGIVILGLFLGVAGESIVQAQNDALQARKSDMRKNVVKDLSKKFDSQTEHQQEAEEELEQKRSKRKTILQEIAEVVVLEAPVIALVCLIGCGVGYIEGWTIIESIYWAVVTGTTIGFGDLAPVNEYVRLACCILMPLMVAVLGELLTRIASAYMERQNQKAEDQFCQRVLTMTDLQNLDANQDGEVSQYEFLTYMLVALGKVEQEDIDEIEDLFNKLDVDNSRTLTKEDLLMDRHWDRSGAGSVATNRSMSKKAARGGDGGEVV